MRRVVLVALLLAALAPGTLRAEVTPLEAKNRARAEELVKSGDVSYRLFKFEQALADYREAYQLAAHPAIIFNIAQAYRQLKKHEKALFYYKLFLSDWAEKFPDRPPPYEAEVRGHIERLGRLVEEEARRRQAKKARKPPPPRKPKVEPGRLELEGLREGAVVTIDGRRSKSGPSVTLAPGRHVVRVELDGFRPWSTAVSLRSGKLHAEQVDLRVSDHRTAWLITSAALTAAAAGVLGFGAYENARYNNFIPGTPEADDSKRRAVIGYAVAGGVAALAAAGWTFYLLHRRKVLRLMEGQTVATSTPGLVRF